ncbi:MAG: acyltransferase [Bacteroidales bacterium]|nr:acyltransferase [Bacteroidales bacterium]
MKKVKFRHRLFSLYTRIIRKLRSKFLVWWYDFDGKRVTIAEGVRIPNPQYVTIDDDTYVDVGAELCANNSIPGLDPLIQIGKRCKVGPLCRLGCDNKIILEDEVRLAPHVHITDRNHTFADPTKSITVQPVVSPGPVIVKTQTWLGFGVQIMPGVTIGRHCVIAAGSIVTKDIPDYSVATGIPAKVIKRYDFDRQEWVRV